MLTRARSASFGRVRQFTSPVSLHVSIIHILKLYSFMLALHVYYMYLLCSMETLLLSTACMIGHVHVYTVRVYMYMYMYVYNYAHACAYTCIFF